MVSLVLDIDGTLLSDAATFPTPSMLRPHVHTFLDFAFRSCRSVGIWTAANDAWCDAFLKAVDPGHEYQWAFTWTGNRVSTHWRHDDDVGCAVPTRLKRLRKIWRKRGGYLRRQGFAQDSTLIVDDNQSVCKDNYGNAIYINPYSYDGSNGADCNDDSLLMLQSYLHRLIEFCATGSSVRSIDKRDWYWKVKAGVSLLDDFHSGKPPPTIETVATTYSDLSAGKDQVATPSTTCSDLPTEVDMADLELSCQSEICPVCDDSGFLLDKSCPLCTQT